MADKTELRKLISEILDSADLNTITTKKVRQQLEEKLDTDLTERRKEVDAIVMEVLNEKNEEKSDESKEDEESEEEKKPKKSSSSNKRKSKKASDSEDEEDDYKPAGKKGKPSKKSKKAASESGSDDEWKKTKAAPKKRGAGGGAKKGGGGTGYTKTCTLSPELSAVMGEPSMARHEVVKRMWKLIKEKNLYDPKNKQFALCNDELLPVFGVKRFRTFGMMKHLKKHFTD